MMKIKMEKQDILDALVGGQRWMKSNKATMTTALSRSNESTIQRGVRWASNVTFDSTLSKMTPEEGYEYLRRKAIEAMANDN